MKRTQIRFSKTILGRFNVTIVDTGATYNVAADVFNNVTGASMRACIGCTDVSEAQLVTLLSDRWTRLITQARKAVV